MKKNASNTLQISVKRSFKASSGYLDFGNTTKHTADETFSNVFRLMKQWTRGPRSNFK